MGLETPFSGKYIDDLVATNPVGASDPKSEGDDHIRGIKLVLQNQFPQLSGPMNCTETELNYLDGVSPGSNLASKAPVLDAQKDLELGTGDVNCTDVTASGTVTGNVTGNLTGNVSGTTVSATTVNATTNLQKGGTNITPTADELNLLDGSATSDAAITIATGDRIIVNDNGTMVQTDVDDLKAYINLSAGTGDVSASGTLTSDRIIKGAGTKTVQASGISIDGSDNVSGVDNLTMNGTFTNGSAVLTEVELEKLDGITNGTVLANKCVIAGASKAINFDGGNMTNVDINSGTIDGTTIGGGTAAAITGTTIKANTSLALASGTTVNDIDTAMAGSPTDNQLLTAQGIKEYVDAKSALTHSGTNLTTTGTTQLGEATNIPSTANQIIVGYVGISTSGADEVILEIGDASYTANNLNAFYSHLGVSDTGFGNLILSQVTNPNAAHTIDGQIIFTRIAGTNGWTFSGVGTPNNQQTYGGYLSTTSAVDRVRITCLSGTFDAGVASVHWL